MRDSSDVAESAHMVAGTLDGLVREWKTFAPGNHQEHDGWSLTGWPKREIRCLCGEVFFATCLRCGAITPTMPDGEVRSHDGPDMITCQPGMSRG